MATVLYSLHCGSLLPLGVTGTDCMLIRLRRSGLKALSWPHMVKSMSVLSFKLLAFFAWSPWHGHPGVKCLRVYSLWTFSSYSSDEGNGGYHCNG